MFEDKEHISLPCRQVEKHSGESECANYKTTSPVWCSVPSLEELISPDTERILRVRRPEVSPPSPQLFNITLQPVTGGTCPCSLTLLSVLGPFYFQSLPLVPSWLLNFPPPRRLLMTINSLHISVALVISWLMTAGWNVHECKPWKQHTLFSRFSLLLCQVFGLWMGRDVCSKHELG